MDPETAMSGSRAFSIGLSGIGLPELVSISDTCISPPEASISPVAAKKMFNFK
jgi:hypothetical protein